MLIGENGLGPSRQESLSWSSDGQNKPCNDVAQDCKNSINNTLMLLQFYIKAVKMQFYIKAPASFYQGSKIITQFIMKWNELMIQEICVTQVLSIFHFAPCPGWNGVIFDKLWCVPPWQLQLLACS